MAGIGPLGDTGNTIIKLGIPYKPENILNSGHIISFSINTLLHGVKQYPPMPLLCDVSLV
jgi:hypothetical protein